ncbi:MAG: TlpA disulfide reductase family protein [Candidatus Acidiferrum sp.]
MKRNAVILILVVVAVAALIYTGARMSKPQNDVGGLPTLKTEGKPAPDFTLQTLDGKSVKLSDFRGKAVLLNFWATWCAPCKVEMPWLVELYQKYQAQGFEIVGVAQDDSGKDAISRFVKEQKVPYTILQGTDPVADAYGGMQFLPASFYIDRNGKIVKTVFGIIGENEIEDNIKLSLGAAAALAANQTRASTSATPDTSAAKNKP